MRVLILIACAIFAAANAAAQELEEIVVTASFSGRSAPGSHLKRPADSLLQIVRITNDSRDDSERESEIHKTLLAAISAAEKNRKLELSWVTEGGFVIPLTKANYKIDLIPGSRPDTSVGYFRVKAAVSESSGSGEELVLEMRDFVGQLKMVGRTEVFADGGVEVSIVNPGQYRAEAINLFAADVRSVIDALGSDYRVVVTGIDQPVEWARSGSTSVAIYIPYSYVVVPTTLNGMTINPDY